MPASSSVELDGGSGKVTNMHINYHLFVPSLQALRVTTALICSLNNCLWLFNDVHGHGTTVLVLTPRHKNIRSSISTRNTVPWPQ